MTMPMSPDPLGGVKPGPQFSPPNATPGVAQLQAVLQSLMQDRAMTREGENEDYQGLTGPVSQKQQIQRVLEALARQRRLQMGQYPVNDADINEANKEKNDL